MTSETEYMMADGQPNEDPVCPYCYCLMDICDYVDYGEGDAICPECGFSEYVKLEYG